jgi:hypothetical protein
VYGADWHSGIRIPRVVVPLLRLVLRGICARAMRGIQRLVLGQARGEAASFAHGSMTCRPSVAMSEPPQP